jgi:hypothetical protein
MSAVVHPWTSCAPLFKLDKEGWERAANCSIPCQLLHSIILNYWCWLRPMGEQQLMQTVLSPVIYPDDSYSQDRDTGANEAYSGRNRPQLR